jgi:hypothetical protein
VDIKGLPSEQAQAGAAVSSGSAAPTPFGTDKNTWDDRNHPKDGKTETLLPQQERHDPRSGQEEPE